MAGDNLKSGRSAAAPPSAIGPVSDEHKWEKYCAESRNFIASSLLAGAQAAFR